MMLSDKKQSTLVRKKRGGVDSRTTQDKIFDGIIFVILTFILLIVAYPLYFIIISSISDPTAVARGEVLFVPQGFNLKGYQEVLKNERVMRGFFNSLVYTTSGVIINLIVTLPTAYALSRSSFGGKKFVTIFYVLTMFISGGMIPTYLVVKNVGLLDSMFALIIPGAVGVYNMIVARTFFKTTISQSLHDAASIDGCGEAKFFFSIALPLSKSIIAILVLYYGVGHWNAYFSSLLYIQTEEKYPLQMILRSILIQNQSSLSLDVTSEAQREALEQRRQLAELMKYSLIIISSLPVLIMYPFIQRHFVKGVMIGSVKG